MLAALHHQRVESGPSQAKHTYDAEGNRRTVPQKSRTLDSVFQDVPYHKIDLHKEWNGRSCNNEEDDDAWPVRFDNISPLKPRPLGKGTYGVVRQFKTIHGQKVAIKSIDVIKPVQLETETIRQCILEPDTINSLHAYHQEQVYPLKQFVDEARYCVFMGRERIGPTVHFVLFSHWPVKHGSTWNVSICMEHFDSNAKEYLQACGHDNLPDLEDQVTRLLQRLANRKVFCIDLKLSNIVMRHTGDRIHDVRMIDFDSGWCERRWSNIPGPSPSIFQSVSGMGRKRRKTMMFLMQFFIMLHTAHYHNVFFCMNAVWYTVRHDPEVLKYAKHYLETRFDNTFSLHYYRQTGRDIFYRVIELLKQQGHVSNDRTTLVFESGETLSLKDKIILQLKDGRVSCSSTSTVFKDVAANIRDARHTSISNAVRMAVSYWNIVPSCSANTQNR